MPPDAPLSRPTLAALAIVFAVVWFAGLDMRTLLHPDEGRYAEIPREMVVTGNWLTPRLNGLKYFEKPPLQYWMTAAAYETFGIQHWTARLWPALSTFLATLYLGYVGARLGGPTLGLYAAAALAGCAGYIINAHLLTLDGALCAFMITALGAFLLAQHHDVTLANQRRWMWVAWAAMAGATLSKGLIGVLIPGASLALYTLVTRDIGVWRRLHLVTGTALFFVIAAPWFIAVSRANPEFFHFFFIHEHFERYLTVTHGRSEPWWYFVPLLIVGMLPWVVVLSWGALRMWRDAAPAANGFSWQRFTLAWSLFVFVFFSASGSKLPSYILPMYPPLCLLVAWLLHDIDPWKLLRLTWPTVLIVAVALPVVAFGSEPLLRHLIADEVSLAPALRFAPWVTAAIAVTVLGGAGAVFALRRAAGRGRTGAVLVLSLSMLVAVQVGLIGYDNFRTTRSSRDILRAAEAVNGPFAADAPFYHVHMHDQTVPFYLGRPTIFVSYRDEFALGQDAEPERAIATDSAWIPVWERLAQGYAMMPARDFERFAAAGVPMRVLARDPRRVLVSRR
jgi:4-amino-4-deoxy-L-arabinose transferase-like glycosyltransferase